MKKVVIISFMLADVICTQAQLWAPFGAVNVSGGPSPATNVGIGTNAPNYPLHVNGFSTFGGGLTKVDFAWNPTNDQRGMILTGVTVPVFGNNGFGSYVAGNAKGAVPNQILGAYLFGQRVPLNSTPQDIGMKAAVHCFATPNGNSPTGYGGIMSLATTEINAGNALQINTERVRIYSDGRVGVGDYRQNPLYPIRIPARRLEVLSDKVSQNANGNPQFRITHTQQNPANPAKTGKFTDFHTTNNGDLAIMTRDNTALAQPRFVGIQTNLPNNTLEINSRLGGPAVLNNQPASIFGPPTGSAGVRFSDLRSTSIPQANPNPNGCVLSVDANGDVIYVPGGAATAFGNQCGLGTNPLSNSWEILLNNWNFRFAGQGPINNNVGIGTSCSPVAKLEVLESSTNPNSIGVLSTNTDVDGVAVRGISNGPATAAQTKVGGWFEATPAAGALQVALYTPQGGGLINLGYPTPSSVGSGGGLLNVNGTGAFNGDVIPVQACNIAQRCGTPANSWWEVWACNGQFQNSDSRLKTNINQLNYGIKEVMKLKPVSYNWKSNPGYGRKVGFIAQELREVISEVVREGDDENKTLSVNYAELVPVLVSAIQDQQKQIDELKTMVQSLATNGATGDKSINGLPVNLSDRNVIVLDQNVPNPFAESTVITYNIPDSFTKAQINFSTADGKIIKTVDIMSKGEGRLNVFANDLSSGVYMYTLVIDGKIIETKKMVKQ